MKKRKPNPEDVPRPSDQFKAFRETMRRLLAVSKTELDQLRAAERAKKNNGEKRPD